MNPLRPAFTFRALPRQLCVLLVLLFIALLQSVSVQAFGLTQCAASRKGSDLGCTANDVSISKIAIASGGSGSCVAGTTTSYDFDVTVNFATPNRWDVGIFLSNDGMAPSLLAATSCSVGVLPMTAPFMDLDGVPTGNPADTCGDGNGAINGGLGYGITRMNTVNVLCQAKPLSNGKLTVPFVVSWDNQASPSGALCTSNLDPVPNTVSKCNSPDGTTAAGVAMMTVDAIVLPTISKTDGISSLSLGTNTTYTVVITNNTGDILRNAVFSDPAVNHLTVSGVSCTTVGGTCPAAGIVTVANMQASGIPIPDMPVGATMTFSIAAKVTGDLTGVPTLTNTASVTVTALSGAGLPISGTNSASDVDTVTGTPSLTLLKRVINASGGIQSPNDFVLTASAIAPGITVVSGASVGIPAIINATTKEGTAVNAVVVPGGSYTLTETTLSGTPVVGYTSSLSCTGGAAVLSASIPMSFSLSGGAATCTLTNSDGVPPSLTIKKISKGPNATLGIGGPFTFNGVSNAAQVVNLAATTTAVGFSGISSAPFLAFSGSVPTGKVTLGAAGVDTVFRETVPDNSWVITAASCIDNNGATTGNGTNPFNISFDQTPGTTGTQDTITIPAAFVKSGADLVCTVTNSRRTIVSTVIAPTTTDTFKLDFYNAAVPVTVTTDTVLPGNGSAGNITPVVNSGSYVLTETDNMGKIVGAVLNYFCLDGNGNTLGSGSVAWGGTAFVTGPTPVIFPTPAGSTLDYLSLQVRCTLKNATTKPFVIIKSATPTAADVFTFTHTATGTDAFAALTTLAGSNNGTSNIFSSTNITGSTAGTYTVTETVPAGWILNTITCYKNGVLLAAGTLPTTPNLVLATGDDGFCFFANARRPLVTVRKILTPTAGNPDTFNLQLKQNAGALTTVVTGGNGATYTTPNTQLSPNDTIVVAETGAGAVNLAYYDSTLVCTDTSVTPNVIVLSTKSSGSASFTSPAFTAKVGQIIDCVFSNAHKPFLTVAKQIVANGSVTRVSPSDEFAISISNGGYSTSTVSPALTATTAATGKYPGIAGVPYTLKEVGVLSTDLSKYTRTSSCTNNGLPYTPASSTSTATESSVTFTPATGDDIVCTFTNTPKSPTLTLLQKTTSGGFGGSFGFTLSNPVTGGIALSTIAADTPVNAGPFTPVIATAITITESGIPAGWTLTDAGCSGLNGADTVDKTNLLTGHYITIPATSVISGADIQCNFTNTKNPAIIVRKVLLGGTGSERFDLKINNVSMDPDGVNLPGNFVNNDSNALTPVYVAPGSAVTVSEFVTAGPTLGNYTTTVDCPGTLISNQVYNPASPPTFIPVSGQTVTCTFSNSLQPKLTLIKNVVGYAAATDSFSINIGGITDPVYLPVTVEAVGGYGSTRTYQAINATTYTFSETGIGATNLANYTSTYSCINANAGGTPNSSGTLTGAPVRSFTVTPVYNDQITCTITNTSVTATISLIKKLATARFAATDQFTVQIKEGAAVVNSTTNSTTSGTGTVTNLTSPDLGITGIYTALAGHTYALTEIAAGTPLADMTKYGTTLNCTNNGVQMSSPLLNGSSAIDLLNPPTIVPAAGDAIVCTMTNTTTLTAYNDYGDAPSGGTVVDTVARNYGSAGHVKPVTPTVYLGTTAPDKELLSVETTWHGQTTADGDDLTGADEGIAQLLSGAPAVFPPLSAGDTSYSLTLVCAGNGTNVAGWIDFDKNGTFEAGERQSAVCTTNLATLNWTGLSNLKTGSTFARFRIATAAGDVANPAGVVSDGEAEDYAFTIRPGVKIIKLLVPAPDAGKFSLTVSGGAPAGGTNPAANVGNTGTTNFVAVDAAGVITVQEVAGTATSLANYTTTLTCTLGDGTTAVTLSASDLTNLTTRSGTFTAPALNTAGTAAQVICTFTNSALVTGVNVTGRVYSDANHNGIPDSAEDWAGGPAVYAKLFAGACPAAGTAVSVQTLSAPAGTYSFTGVAAGNYCIVLSSNATAADTVASTPANWFNGTPTSGVLSVTVAATNVPEQNFGLFTGSRLAGRVFLDNGAGAFANNGVQDSGEVGINGVTVTANQAGCASTLCAAAITDGNGDYVMWLPSSVTGAVTVTEVNLSGYLSTGGQAGNTGGTYTRSTDTTAFSVVAGSNYSGVNFADVPDNQFLTDGAQSAMPGSVAFYPHTFIAGTSGAVSFAVSKISSPAITGWSEVIYVDVNCNAVIDAGEVVLSASVAVTAAQTVCLLVKEFIPAAAPINAQNALTITATLDATFSGSAVSFNYLRHDTTTAGQATGSGLTLVKSVSTATALPGGDITYTVAYTNKSSGLLSSVIIYDATPSYTLFRSASCGVLPLNFSGCVITAPAVNATGSIVYTMAGTLAPGSSGAVNFVVRVQP
ncbi:MAG: GEVED domain-containing protein [Gallionella sp.]|nr:GEVED domain-containing protein [Gallionella sp.]